MLNDVGLRPGIRVRASKGVHLVVPRSAITGEAGLILRTATSRCSSSSRGAGTGSSAPPTPTGGWTASHPAASARDIDYLLDQVNAVLDRPLTTADIEGVYAGLRPLLAGEADSTSQALPRARGLRADARAAAGRGRQVHDVPGDGRRRGRPGRPPARRAYRPLAHRRPAAARRRRVRRRCGGTGPTWPAGTGSRSAWSSTCWSGTARSPCDLLALIDADPLLRLAAGRRAGVPGRRGGVRGPGRGGAAPGGRADPAYPDLLRDRPPGRWSRPSTRPS